MTSSHTSISLKSMKKTFFESKYKTKQAKHFLEMQHIFLIRLFSKLKINAGFLKSRSVFVYIYQ